MTSSNIFDVSMCCMSIKFLKQNIICFGCLEDNFKCWIFSWRCLGIQNLGKALINSSLSTVTSDSKWNQVAKFESEMAPYICSQETDWRRPLPRLVYLKIAFVSLACCCNVVDLSIVRSENFKRSFPLATAEYVKTHSALLALRCKTNSLRVGLP